jgi:hypothetical protein
MLSLNTILTQEKIRCHGYILPLPWARIWYLARLSDRAGRGLVTLPWFLTKFTLRAKESTLWHWLAEGKEAGAFQNYYRQGNKLYIRLGSRDRICRTLNLANWGETFELTLSQIVTLSDARANAVIAAIDSRQDASRYAAWLKLPPQERKQRRLPKAWEIFDSVKEIRLSTSGRRATAISYLLHASPKHFFVSKGFIPYGISQRAIAGEFNVTDRTIRRYCDRTGIDRRQVLQAKSSYRDIRIAHIGGGGGITNDYSFAIYDRDRRLEITQDRLFDYLGKTWLSRCNLYDTRIERIPERAARRKYKRSLSLSNAAAAEIKGDFRLNNLMLEKSQSGDRLG